MGGGTAARFQALHSSICQERCFVHLMTISDSTLSNCRLQWGRRYQEEELLALRLEVGEVSREVEVETKQLRDREEIIRAIRDEQRQVRPYVGVAFACVVRPSRDSRPPPPLDVGR